MGTKFNIFIVVLFVFSTLSVDDLAVATHEKSTQLWSDADFKKAQKATDDEILKPGGPPVLLKRKTIYIRPPFYNGKLPLTYAVKEWGVPGIYLTLSMEFGEWNNEFIYLDINEKNYVLADGVRAKERVSGRVVAEAKLLDPFLGTPKPILVEEWHYGEDGKTIFKCKSYFSKESFFKESETTTWGKKVRDYFLIWPMGR